MRTDYLICPKCSKGRLVPLMFGPGKCDLACENTPAARSAGCIGVSFDDLYRRSGAQSAQNVFAGHLVVQTGKPLIHTGNLPVQQHLFRSMPHRYTFYFEKKQPQFLYKNVRNTHAQAIVHTRIWSAQMPIKTGGQLVIVLLPSDDQKQLWGPASSIPATIELLP